MNNIRKKIHNLFRKNKELVINNKENSLTLNKNNFIDLEHAKPTIKTIKELTDENLNRNEDIKLRIQAFSFKTKDLEFAVAYYNATTGIITNINSKLFADLDSFERVTWAYSQTSADIIYGYKDIDNNLIVSSKYLLNAIKHLESVDALGDIIYEVKSRSITLKENSTANTNNYVTIQAYSVCGIVSIIKELSEQGYNIIKI